MTGFLPESREERLQLLLRLTAMMFAATLILSFKAWVSTREYPLLPIVAGWRIGYPFDYTLLAVLIAALLGAGLGKRPLVPLVFALGLMIFLALFDRNRWQPYVAHFVVVLGCLAVWTWRRTRQKNGDEWAFVPLRLFLAFTYIYAGVHKLNLAYCADVFPWMVNGGLKPIMGFVILPDDYLWLMLPALATAVAEAAAGLLLLFDRTAERAAWFLIWMHVVVLFLLGPFCLRYNLIVWPWNLAMIVALGLTILRGKGEKLPQENLKQKLRLLFESVKGGKGPLVKWAATTGAVVLLFGVMPVLSFWHKWPDYFSFNVYSGNIYEGHLILNRDEIQHLPREAQRLLKPDKDMNLNDWASGEMEVFPYPEKEGFLEVAHQLAARMPEKRICIMLKWGPQFLEEEKKEATYCCYADGRPPDQMDADRK